MKRNSNGRLLGAGAIPLAIYPFILIPTLMSLAGHQPATPPPLPLRIAATGFLWGALLYPVQYVVCAVIVWVLKDLPPDIMKHRRVVTFVAAFPLLYFATVVALCVAWVNLG
jgi:hypothetical protein